MGIIPNYVKNTYSKAVDIGSQVYEELKSTQMCGRGYDLIEWTNGKLRDFAYTIHDKADDLFKGNKHFIDVEKNNDDYSLSEDECFVMKSDKSKVSTRIYRSKHKVEINRDDTEKDNVDIDEKEYYIYIKSEEKRDPATWGNKLKAVPAYAFYAVIWTVQKLVKAILYIPGLLLAVPASVEYVAETLVVKATSKDYFRAFPQVELVYDDSLPVVPVKYDNSIEEDDGDEDSSGIETNE